MNEEKRCPDAALSEPPLDPAAILAHLGVPDAESIVPLHGGADSALWQVVRSEGTYALRVLRADQAEVGEREALAMQLAAAAGVPVPRVHRLAMWQCRPALLLSWCPGTTLAEFLQGRPWLVWPMGARFGQVLARLHTVPPPEPWRQADQDWIGDLGPEEAPLQTRLRALTAGQERLLHLDYHPLNVMTDGREITGVLDRSLLRLLELACLSGYRRAAGPIRDLAPFRAWAWDFMARDLEPKRGRPGFWLQPWHLARMRQQAGLWKRRAGIDPS